MIKFTEKEIQEKLIENNKDEIFYKSYYALQKALLCCYSPTHPVEIWHCTKEIEEKLRSLDFNKTEIVRSFIYSLYRDMCSMDPVCDVNLVFATMILKLSSATEQAGDNPYKDIITTIISIIKYQDYCMDYLNNFGKRSNSENYNTEVVAVNYITKEDKVAVMKKKFMPLFKNSFTGKIPNSVDSLTPMVSKLVNQYSEKDYARIALMIYRSNILINKYSTFKAWYKEFCDIVGCPINENYKPNKLDVPEKLKDQFYMLQSH